MLPKPRRQHGCTALTRDRSVMVASRARRVLSLALLVVGACASTPARKGTNTNAREHAPQRGTGLRAPPAAHDAGSSGAAAASSRPTDAASGEHTAATGSADRGRAANDRQPNVLVAPAPSSAAGMSPGGHAGKTVKAFYFGHSLLAGSGASPNHHIPYDVGIFAAAKGHRYEAHGQLGWGTPLRAHWAWSSDDLAQGPPGFSQENHPPFYAGRNGKAELTSGGYNVVVFTDVNGNARGADPEPVVEALLGLIRLARARDPNTQTILYSCWNELPVASQSDAAAVSAWRDVTLAELGWWESVTDAVNARIAPARMLLVPVSAVIAELARDASLGRISGGDAPLNASAFFVDDVHGTPLTYYAAAAALYTAIFQESPLGATEDVVRRDVGDVVVDYTLPSLQAVDHIQRRAFELVRDYARAGFAR